MPQMRAAAGVVTIREPLYAPRVPPGLHRPSHSPRGHGNAAFTVPSPPLAAALEAK